MNMVNRSVEIKKPNTPIDSRVNHRKYSLVSGCRRQEANVPVNTIMAESSSMATEMVKGKTIQEALEVTNKAVMEALDGLPPVKVHCSLLAEEAIHAALWDYAEKNGIKIEGLEKPKSDISEEEEEEEY